MSTDWRRHLRFAAWHARGATFQLLGRVSGDPLVAFRGQQDMLRAKLARRAVVDDSYLGPSVRPPVRMIADPRSSRLRLVASA